MQGPQQTGSSVRTPAGNPREHRLLVGLMGGEMSFLEQLHAAKAESAARDADPWRLPLERLHGKIGDDGIERIPPSCCSTSLGFPNAVEEPGHAGVWRN